MTSRRNRQPASASARLRNARSLSGPRRSADGALPLIYLDTSALVKLVFEEAESGALALWLTGQEGLPKLSSEVAVIELVRTCRRRHEEAEPSVRRLLAGLDLVPLTRDLVEGACLVRPAVLRSLGAIHLACAVSLADALSYFVAYDAKLSSAAGAVGLPVLTPA